MRSGMSRESPRRTTLARTNICAATLPPSRPFAPHLRRFAPDAQFSRAWFKEFAELLNPRNPSSVHLVDMTNEELGMNAERRAAIEKHTNPSKANYFIKELGTGQAFFVKQSLNLDRLKREWVRRGDSPPLPCPPLSDLVSLRARSSASIASPQY